MGAGQYKDQGNIGRRGGAETPKSHVGRVDEGVTTVEVALRRVVKHSCTNDARRDWFGWARKQVRLVQEVGVNKSACKKRWWE